MTDNPNKTGMWQPIETAPKNGSEVLLRVKRGKCLVGHYMPGGHCIEDHPPIAPGWYFWDGRMFDQASEPTHWMPLPAPPSQTSIQPPPAAVGPRAEEPSESRVQAALAGILETYPSHPSPEFAQALAEGSRALKAAESPAPSVELQDDLSQRLREYSASQWLLPVFTANLMREAAERLDAMRRDQREGWIRAGQLADRIDALQADAERYRWLRNQRTSMNDLTRVINDDYQPPYIAIKFGDELDAAVDAARRLAKAPQNG